MSDDIITIRQSQLARIERVLSWAEQQMDIHPKPEKQLHAACINWCRINPTLEMSATPITRRQWVSVMVNDPSYHQSGSLDSPVENVTYDQCVEFCAKIGARLPTEAEWVEALGTNYEPTRDTSWFGSAPDVVARRTPNQFGLYDMFGNVWEWCDGRVLRGGSFDDEAGLCRSAFRNYWLPGNRGNDLGFRVSRTVYLAALPPDPKGTE